MNKKLTINFSTTSAEILNPNFEALREFEVPDDNDRNYEHKSKSALSFCFGDEEDSNDYGHEQ